MIEDDITLNGKLESISASERKFVLMDVDGISHGLNWLPVLDVVMLKGTEPRWKYGYLTVTMTKDESVKNVKYWPEGKDQFPKQHKGGSSGRQYQPRNERIIVLQTCYKECAEMARQAIMQFVMPNVHEDTERPQDVIEDYLNQYMDWVINRAKKDADELCQHGGVK